MAVSWSQRGDDPGRVAIHGQRLGKPRRRCAESWGACTAGTAGPPAAAGPGCRWSLVEVGKLMNLNRKAAKLGLDSRKKAISNWLGHCELWEKVERNQFGEFEPESEYVQMMVWYWETIRLMALKAGVRIMMKLCRSHLAQIFALFGWAWIEHDWL